MKRILSNIGSEESGGTYRVTGTVTNRPSVPGELVAAAPARVTFYEGSSYPEAMAKMEELRTVMTTEGVLPEPAAV